MSQAIHYEMTTTRPRSAVRQFRAPTEGWKVFDIQRGDAPKSKIVNLSQFRESHATTTNYAPAMPSPKDMLDAELLAYRDLPPGWDGYEGVPASIDAISDAFDFLDKMPEDIPLPYPQIATDGEVGLYWRTDEVYVEVGFYGDGEFSYYARYTPSAGGEPQEDGRDHSGLHAEEWPEGLLSILNKLER